MQAEMIKSQPIATQVYEILKNNILEGVYAPGDKISEQDVADSLQISRSPVREAIRQLSNEGLVDFFPHRGAYLKQYTCKDVHDSFQVRLLMEVYAVENIDPVLHEELCPAVDKLLAQVQNGDRKENDALDVQVHEMAILMTGNTILLNMYRLLYTQISTFRAISISDTALMNAAKRSHVALLRALKRKDTERAIYVIKKHLHESEELVQNYYRR